MHECARQTNRQLGLPAREATMQNRIHRRIANKIRSVQKGQGLVEYALLLVLIAIASITILSALGSGISVLYSVSNVFVAP